MPSNNIVRMIFPKRLGGKNALPDSLRGWPDTVKIEDPENQGRPGLQVYDYCVSPGGRRTAEIIAVLVAGTVGIDMVILGIDVGTLEFFLPALAGIVGVYFLSKKIFSWLFSRIVWIRLFADRVEVAGWSKFQTYKANVGYVFRLDDHEKAVEEELQTRQNPNASRHYTNSQKLFLTHGKQDVFIADVYPREKARAFISRLSAILHGFELGSFN